MKKKSSSSFKRRQNLPAYLFLTPWLIGIVLFTIIPIFYTIYLSFNNVNQTGLGYQLTWVGFRNFYTMFFSIVEFIPALINFILMQIIYVPVIVVVSFILGLLLNQKFKFRTTFRTIFFLPVIILSGPVLQQFMVSGATSFASISDLLIFRMVANYSRSLARGIEILFLNFTIVLWFTGIPIVLFINALQKIDRGLYEAADIDGASWWQKIWKIVIPNVKSTALVVSIYTIVTLGLYDINPRNDGNPTLYQLIQRAIADSTKSLGMASAYAVIYTIVVLLTIGLAFLIFRDRDVLKKQESLQERQRKKIQRIQRRNRRRDQSVREFFQEIKMKFQKGRVEKHEKA
ncbi:MAG TPA: sugar ABC transporter permease [Haloplasmataceae bacterium]